MQQIDRFISLLQEAFGPLGPVYVLGGFGLLLVVSVAPLLLVRGTDPIEKLGRAPEGRGGDPRSRRPERPGVRREGLRRDGAGRLDALADPFTPKDEESVSSAKRMLLQAGYRSTSAVRTYYLARVMGAVTFGVLGFLYIFLSRGTEDLTWLAICSAGGMGVGYIAPNYWVTRRRQARQEEIGNGFPDALDMMLVCVEAGQSLDQSLVRVAGEIDHAHPSLAEEFQIISVEIRAGKDRAVVLREFADRAGVNDVSSFVTVLIQSTQFGTSVAEALRIYAAEMRDKRLMRAEEKANKIPTKLTLGTMLFTVPPLMLILIGPSIIDIINALTGMRN
ncbi:MAG: type II secretion system F family protein [Paracoccaceae bacterium]